LLNLAGNALKFTKAGTVEIEAKLEGEQLVYRVADTGIGIPADKIGSLFTEFKQTDAMIASEYGGTGLGLSISRANWARGPRSFLKFHFVREQHERQDDSVRRGQRREP
jgi:signal transduction histidine kinase